ncbi:hypothetical protein D3OALGA1CA_5658 [Olavius algarvensis associated proteobacterium Delta 3]|nr:hypothetical protein D3OALGB2SA_4434 [Olavius algarvensis associated proteobacterium Delta 3]CAB5169645.1 hypothetical protein D3OALGA1CA_5658 [Olavius algarvensis associated proteobacterium Delta 3]
MPSCEIFLCGLCELRERYFFSASRIPFAREPEGELFH